MQLFLSGIHAFFSSTFSGEKAEREAQCSSKKSNNKSAVSKMVRKFTIKDIIMLLRLSKVGWSGVGVDKLPSSVARPAIWKLL